MLEDDKRDGRDELQSLIAQLGMQPADVAELFGMHRSTPYKWLSGDVGAPAWLLVHLRILCRLRALCRTAFVAQGDLSTTRIPARLRHSSQISRPSPKGYESDENVPSEVNEAPILDAMDDEPSSMTPSDFKAALGAIGWRQADFARHVGFEDKTASRWAVGKSPIPKWVAVHLELLMQIQELQQFLMPKREKKARGSPE